MKILAFDTASKSCSAAIIDGNIILGEFLLNHQDTHSKYLLGMIDSLFSHCNLTIKDIDGFGVTIGPGSFTGLRIGLSTLKALAFVTGKPVFPLSSLAALAYQFPSNNTLICSMLDARRNEVYTAQYKFIDEVLEEVSPPAAVSVEEAIAGISEPCIFVGDGAMLYKQFIKDALGSIASFPIVGNQINASVVALAAAKYFNRVNVDNFINFHDIVPLYIRKSDAEKNIR
jgi:tRNA threonylcarbamoyladenosine biosynthesis protein TsaB